MQTLDDFSHGSHSRAGSAVSVLVVDDETAVRRFAARVLERDGLSVTEATDGAEALEMIRSQQPPFDVVVADIVMPRMNGVELMQALAITHARLPIILMSGYAATALSDLGIATPCCILPKPFSPERLLAEVHRCVGQPDGGSSAA